MRQFLLVLLIVAIAVVSSVAQTKAEKITSEEYIEANELSRHFFAVFADTMDIKSLIKDFGTSDFYDCVEHGDAPFVRSNQAEKMSMVQRRRFYIAETNFLMAIFMWGTNSPGSTGGFSFKMLPTQVKTILTKQTFDAMVKNDSSDANLSDAETRKYINSLLPKLERSIPIFRNRVKNAGGRNSRGFRDAMRFFEFESTIADYLFRPELKTESKSCGSVSVGGRVLYADIPFFQIQMVKVNGRLKVHQLVFHVD
ncbi:MAG: hypothetical protein QM785_03290 [Pyrinomonadaceae bacterium]